MSTSTLGSEIIGGGRGAGGVGKDSSTTCRGGIANLEADAPAGGGRRISVGKPPGGVANRISTVIETEYYSKLLVQLNVKIIEKY